MWLAVAVLVLACALAVWGHMRLSSSDEASSAEGAAAEAELADAVSRVEEAQVTASSAATFLSDLARAEPSASQGVIWEDDEDVPACAASVLKSYQGREGCELACSGYMDIKGNAWGAVVWSPPDWVDVIYITVPDGGETSTVRIVRLTSADGV